MQMLLSVLHDVLFASLRNAPHYPSYLCAILRMAGGLYVEYAWSLTGDVYLLLLIRRAQLGLFSVCELWRGMHVLPRLNIFTPHGCHCFD
jgi:hypothetical protein